MKWLRRLAAFSALVLCIGILWAAYIPLREYHETHYPNHTSTKQNTDDPFASLVGIIEQHHDLWIVLKTLALVFFTATLWFSTRQLQKTTEGHAEHLEGSADAAKRAADVAARALIANQRPWIHAEVSISRPMQFQQNGDVTITLDFTMNNVGNSPALFAWPYARAILGSEDVNFLQIQQEVWNNIRNEKHQIDLGLTVFQNNPVLARTSVTITASQIERNRQARASKRIMPIIVGIIDYQFPFNDDHGRTGFVYIMGYANATNIAIPLGDGEVRPEHLTVMPWIGSASVFRAS